MHSWNCRIPFEFSDNFLQNGTALSGTDVVVGDVVEEARRLVVWAPRTPWEQWCNRPYNGSKLVPFGRKCTWLNDGGDTRFPHEEFQQRGRAGVIVGYGQLSSYLVLDLLEYEENHSIVLRLTRDLRVHTNEFP